MKEGEYYDATNRRKLTVLPGGKFKLTEHNGEVKEFEKGTIILGGQWEKIEVSPLDKLIDKLRGK